MEEYNPPTGHQSEANPGPGVRKLPEEEEKGHDPESSLDEAEYEMYFDERGRAQYRQKAKGSPDIFTENNEYDPNYYVRTIPQIPLRPIQTTPVLQTDTWRQVAEKYIERIPNHQWPLEVQFMHMAYEM